MFKCPPPKNNSESFFFSAIIYFLFSQYNALTFAPNSASLGVSKIVLPSIVITLSIDSREFTDLLEEQLQILIDFEEYESCAMVVKLQNKLNKQKV
jgi:hypothetical protein